MQKLLSILLVLATLAPGLAASELCVVCSVQQQELSPEECSLSQLHGDKTFYFCNNSCLVTFKQEPDEWAGQFQKLVSAEDQESERGSVVPS